MKIKEIISGPSLCVGIAIFTMIFGAGNIIFPISIGNFVGHNYWLGFLGIFLSSVLIPLAGLFACLHYHGNYENFLTSWIGRTPTIFATVVAMLILGPLGCIPRCATLAHAALSWSILPGVSFVWFSLIFFAAVFILSLQQDRLIQIFGKFLGPINLLFMATLIIKGYFWATGSCLCGPDALESFKVGFMESYKTFDLLAMIFYSSSIVAAVAAYLKSASSLNADLFSLCRRGAIVAAGIFTIIYFCFCMIAAKNAHLIPVVGKEYLVSAYAAAILGDGFGAIAGLIILLACFNSACALSVVFSRYLVKVAHIVGLSYVQALACTTMFSFGFSKLGFSGIDNAVSPIAQIVYPVLILISIFGAFQALWLRHDQKNLIIK